MRPFVRRLIHFPICFLLLEPFLLLSFSVFDLLTALIRWGLVKRNIFDEREREQGMAREKPTATKKNSLLWCFCCVSTLCESKTGGKFISFSITNLIICESEIETERMRVVSDEPKILVILFLVPFFVKLNNKAATQATTTKMTTNY